MIAKSIVTNDSRRRYPELYQFFAGYFYQGWVNDYRWEGAEPTFKSVVRHFRAVNPPSLVQTVRDQLSHLVTSNDPDDLPRILSELGNSFSADYEGLSCAAWIEQIVDVLSESASAAIVLRERN